MDVKMRTPARIHLHALDCVAFRPALLQSRRTFKDHRRSGIKGQRSQRPAGDPQNLPVYQVSRTRVSSSHETRVPATCPRWPARDCTSRRRGPPPSGAAQNYLLHVLRRPQLDHPVRVGMLPADDLAGPDFQQFPVERIAVAEAEVVAARRWTPPAYWWSRPAQGRGVADAPSAARNSQGDARAITHPVHQIPWRRRSRLALWGGPG